MPFTLRNADLAKTLAVSDVLDILETLKRELTEEGALENWEYETYVTDGAYVQMTPAEIRSTIEDRFSEANEALAWLIQ